MKKKTIWDLNRDTAEQYRSRTKIPLVIVLDNVRSLNNVGAIFRTCDAFIVEKILLCGITATPPSQEIHKTALGAEDSVAWEYCADTLEAVSVLKADGYTVCSLEQVEQSVMLQDFVTQPGHGYAIILGNEVKGVDQRVVDISDYCIEIPQCGTKHSLNVSVSAGLAIWHFFIRMGL
ncbi:MAG: RNA methyltransferase [Pseudoflavonifractor sp.]|nr:RNA methyltransferase [Pseudoflavonifractor sp.]